LGPIPGDLQNYVVFGAGVSSVARDLKAARSLVDYLRSPAVQATLKAKGMEGM
jgi:molybdate transport system substrate-binding protein